jgi:NADH-quinone oxidoreductase subunit G
MTRCIHCTRCIRFLEEIAGTSEMGGSGRGDRLEIGTCIESSIDSELSGNIIDMCPVGALTNKPFRFSARSWELMAKPSIAAHDGVGSKLYYHGRQGEILRAVPAESESSNETWLSDRDRYSHFGLYSDDRVLAPRIRENGEWRTASWEAGISAAAQALKGVIEENGASALGVLMSPGAFNEEFFLAQRLTRALGCHNIDHRLREQDFLDDTALPTTPSFEASIAELEQAQAIMLVGSNIRHEAPILGHRVRKAWMAGAVITAINPLDWDFHFGVQQKIITAPQGMVDALAGVAVAVSEFTKSSLPGYLAGVVAGIEPGEEHREAARTLAASESGVVLLGQMAMSHPLASSLRQLAAWIATTTDSRLNLLPHGGNATGAWRTGAVPHRGPGGKAGDPGLDVRGMLEKPRKAYLLWDFEPDFDLANPSLSGTALAAADKVVVITSFATDYIEGLADVILPLAPIAESEGTLYNLDGNARQVSPAGLASGECKPGWKILRQLGEELGLDGFGQVGLVEIRAQMEAESAGEAEQLEVPEPGVGTRVKGLHRVGEVPMYGTDALCRRSDALQQTVHADSAFIGLNPVDASALKLEDGMTASFDQGGDTVELAVRVSTAVPEDAAWIRSATCATRVLGDSFGPVNVAGGTKRGGGST